MRDQYSHVKPIENWLAEQAEFFYDETWEPDRLITERPDLVICVNDFHLDVVRCLEAAKKVNIPSLVLQDGILEWRCQFENPHFGYGGGAPQHQPVMADKIACIGPQSARQIACWGNATKVEVTGMPRLDLVRSRTKNPVNKPGKTVLVMTAKKPWFTDQQREITLRSLIDVKTYLDQQPEIQVVWRVTKGIANLIGVENRLGELSTRDLVEVLDSVDAVITTVSTTILESMLAGRPVAALDYHNVPRFVPTVWSISSVEHIGQVITEILNPPGSKWQYQQNILSDLVRCDRPAASQVSELISKMVHLGREAREKQTSLALPPNMMGWSFLGTYLNQSVDLADLYPDQQVFQKENITLLQAKLARAEYENQQLKQKITQQTIGALFNRSANWVYRKIFAK